MFLEPGEMKPALALLVILTLSRLGFSQEGKVTDEAVRLLERANAASTSPNLPNLERVDRFRAFGPGSAFHEGSFTRVVIQGTGRRDEYNFAGYHLLNVWTGRQVAVEGTQPRILPPELAEVVRLTPINLVRFDAEDVIHAIASRIVGGRPAECIEFATVKGEQIQDNELCVDTSNGTLLLERLGAEQIENSDFFPFAGALMPGKILYSFAGAQKLEITQTMSALTDTTKNVLVAPANATMHKICTTYRRPFGVSMPQPPGGNGGGRADVVVRGWVGPDGRVYDATVQSSERPDLDPEALTWARQWVFTPPMCDGRPDAHEVELTLHFQGR
jgi:TonB family protein